jgi:hypothetical protein
MAKAGRRKVKAMTQAYCARDNARGSLLIARRLGPPNIGA